MIDPATLDADPMSQFQTWFGEARAAMPAAEAVALATATPAGRPSLRMVLAKGADARGLVFYTGLESRKGHELAVNPHAALLFHWAPLGRQVRVEGPVTRVPDEEAAAYFASRPPGSRISAWASPQSEVVASRGELERRFVEAKERLGDESPLPPHWGGFRLAPEAWEFWLHRDERLHDRVRYLREGTGWRRERLGP